MDNFRISLFTFYDLCFLVFAFGSLAVFMTICEKIQQRRKSKS
jgi:hypothetical protein